MLYSDDNEALQVSRRKKFKVCHCQWNIVKKVKRSNLNDFAIFYILLYSQVDFC